MAKPRRKTGDSAFTSATENAVLAQTTGDTTAADLDRDRIAARAYELYLARGGGDGMDMEDWLVAERELRNGSNGDR
jgi:hypothetical protein